MSYTPPAGNAAHLNFSTASGYTPSAGNAAHLDFAATAGASGYVACLGPLGSPAVVVLYTAAGRVSAPGPLATPSVLAASVRQAWVSAPSVLGVPALFCAAGESFRAYVAVPGPMGVPAVAGSQPVQGRISLPPMLGDPVVLGSLVYGLVSATGPLGAPALLADHAVGVRLAVPSLLVAPLLLVTHDFTGQLGDAVSRYVMDLVTPNGLVRVPISSWQATLRAEGSNYVQCVVPAVLDWVTTINAATEFVVSRRAVLPSGQAIEYEMARMAVEQATLDRGPRNYTATISGYTTAISNGGVEPPAALDRTLTGVRSISQSGGVRVRCSVDWLLRPGQRAWVDAKTSFVVSYINYYVMRADAYMDVGSS